MPEKFTFKKVQEYFKSQNCELLATEYINNRIKMEYICICKNKSSINFDNFKRGSRCKNCEPNKTRTKYTFKYVSGYFKEQGCVLIVFVETNQVVILIILKEEINVEIVKHLQLKKLKSILKNKIVNYFQQNIKTQKLF
jgi:hypothetical protein